MAEKILIVDDDPDTIEFLKLLLERQGYQTVAALNGMQALSVAHSEKPDLVILDVMMPDLDGFEVARSLRRHPDTALTPILMFTAKTQVEDKVAGYEAGVDIYLTKPVHPVELQANIKALVSQKRARVSTDTTHGYLVGVIAASGGLGVSTTTLNLAIVCHHQNKNKVVAAEMRPGQGSWFQELKLPDTRCLEDLLKLSPEEITLSTVEEKLILTNYGVKLLLASDQPKDIEYINAILQYEAIIEQLIMSAELIFLDIGTYFLPAFETIADVSNEMVVITEPQPMSIKKTGHLIEELRSKGYGSAKPLTVTIINRARVEMSLSVSQIEEELGCAVALGIPPAPEQAYFAAMNNVPLSLVQKEGLIAQQYNKLAEVITRHIQI